MSRNNKKTTVFAIIVLVCLVVLMFQFVSTGKLDVTSITTPNFNTDTCRVVKECNGDCTSVCEMYDVCTVKTFENKQIACVNGDNIEIKIQEPTVQTQIIQSANGGGGQ